MATNRLLLCTFLLLSSIIITISADLVADRLAKVTAWANQPNRERDSFLRCFWLLERYRYSAGKYDSVQDELEYEICRTGSRLAWQPTYENTGRLPPGYKEALLIWHNNNQTMVDIEICQYDYRRCPEELKELAFFND